MVEGVKDEVDIAVVEVMVVDVDVVVVGGGAVDEAVTEREYPESGNPLELQPERKSVRVSN